MNLYLLYCFTLIIRSELYSLEVHSYCQQGELIIGVSLNVFFFFSKISKDAQQLSGMINKIPSGLIWCITTLQSNNRIEIITLFSYFAEITWRWSMEPEHRWISNQPVKEIKQERFPLDRYWKNAENWCKKHVVIWTTVDKPVPMTYFLGMCWFIRLNNELLHEILNFKKTHIDSQMLKKKSGTFSTGLISLTVL